MVSWATARTGLGRCRADARPLSLAAECQGRSSTRCRYARRTTTGRFLAVADHQPRHLGPRLRGDGMMMRDRLGRATAVSLTPVSLDADSRAFRIARSLADAGFRSLVIEGRASERPFWGPEIEVRSAANSRTATTPLKRSGAPLRNTVNALRGGGLGKAGELALYSGFRGYDWWRHCRQPGHLLPPADLYYLHSFELHRIVAPTASRLGAQVIYDA